MTRFIHDQFAKDYLEELLKNYGKVEPDEKVSEEKKEIFYFYCRFRSLVKSIKIFTVIASLAEWSVAIPIPGIASLRDATHTI